ncbi:hypothetical protein E2L08_02845 [Palleronia sediminis]|uniref:Hedgehog/Intein (Hint) domain-containing protein n=1 Tax=Palleronia sediminis TaxID=2547833 RepID=A0A4R6AHD2_9RHOB|nr:Hint domain-containing protein [Palleronia sediminis]TDL83601.1 hypothetical protein E2L08_02845 [Palleronia sediminis]
MTQIAKTGARTQTGLVAGTRVMTSDGMLPVEFLEAGDRIVTRQGLRRLRAVSVVERTAQQVVTIRASVLGHDRPEHPLRVAADQPVVLRDWRARAMFGTDTAVVPARRLVDGDFISETPVARLRSFVLVFDTPQIVYAEGAEVAMGASQDATA